jgi:hypothetical protein
MRSRSARIRLVARPPVPRLGKALGRPLAPATFRVPRRSAALVFPAHSPQIFVHEGVRQALERRLMAAFPGPVLLSITDNRHSMISHSTERGVLHVRIHHMFLDAPSDVLDMLVLYLTRGDRLASVRVGHFIEDASSRIVRHTPRSSLDTKGKTHDLLAIFDDVNSRYFDASVTALITWGKGGRRPARARSTIKLGSYSAAERLIRVHRASRSSSSTRCCTMFCPAAEAVPGGASSILPCSATVSARSVTSSEPSTGRNATSVASSGAKLRPVGRAHGPETPHRFVPLAPRWGRIDRLWGREG